MQIRLEVELQHVVPRLLWGNDVQAWERWSITLHVAVSPIGASAISSHHAAHACMQTGPWLPRRCVRTCQALQPLHAGACIDATTCHMSPHCRRIAHMPELVAPLEHVVDNRDPELPFLHKASFRRACISAITDTRTDIRGAGGGGPQHAPRAKCCHHAHVTSACDELWCVMCLAMQQVTSMFTGSCSCWRPWTPGRSQWWSVTW